MPAKKRKVRPQQDIFSRRSPGKSGGKGGSRSGTKSSQAGRLASARKGANRRRKTR